MLKVLRIKNFLLIEQMSLEFQPGFTVISGETGSGKSILVDAISFLIGSKMKPELIRSGSSEAWIEGIFNAGPLQSRLQEYNIPLSEYVTVRRLITKQGKQKIWLNDTLVSITTLITCMKDIVSIGSQTHQQTLLSSVTQLHYLDSFLGLKPLVETFQKDYLHFQSTLKEYTQIQLKLDEIEKSHDLWEFQKTEIESMNPTLTEDLELAEKKIWLQSSSLRFSLAQKCQSILEEQDADSTGLLARIRILLPIFKDLVKMDSAYEPYLEPMFGALQDLEDLSLSLNRYLTTFENHDDQLEQTFQRLSKLTDLKRKYGGSLDSVLEYKRTLEEKLKSRTSLEGKRVVLQKSLEGLQKDLEVRALTLTQERQQGAKDFCQQVILALQDLKLNARFEIEISTTKMSGVGCDYVRFLVQTNPGENLLPLTDIISGGELSRFMLAIHNVCGSQGECYTQIFDEIDVGIGGPTAFAVGSKLKALAAKYQIFCVTHLAQVACFADHHIQVVKEMLPESTSTHIRLLTYDEKLEELARMLGGSRVTSSSLNAARDLVYLTNHV
jgi:DNA repair protein RecN (Recombination protein N)